MMWGPCLYFLNPMHPTWPPVPSTFIFLPEGYDFAGQKYQGINTSQVQLQSMTEESWCPNTSTPSLLHWQDAETSVLCCFQSSQWDETPVTHSSNWHDRTPFIGCLPLLVFPGTTSPNQLSAIESLSQGLFLRELRLRQLVWSWAQ